MALTREQFKTETPIRATDLADWFRKEFAATGQYQNLNRSTVTRWRAKGRNGIKLATLRLEGGEVWTTIEAVWRFLQNSSEPNEEAVAAAINQERHAAAIAHLTEEGLMPSS